MLGLGENYDKTRNESLFEWTDADLEWDILTQCLTTISVHTWGKVRFVVQCINQPDMTTSTYDAEVRALWHVIKQTLLYRKILRSINIPQRIPTPIYEDNAATNTQAINNRLTPRVKHIGILIGWFNEWYSRERMQLISCPSSEQKGDIHSTPYGVVSISQ